MGRPVSYLIPEEWQPLAPCHPCETLKPCAAGGRGGEVYSLAPSLTYGYPLRGFRNALPCPGIIQSAMATTLARLASSASCFHAMDRFLGSYRQATRDASA